ncbi:MAG TPA: energy-coupling factor transporter transmembrane component T [bacterium]|nr:energy-coupling factor transporter transmembrane component T [bacterium]
MHRALLSPYHSRQGLLHRVPPTAKLLGAVIVVVAIVLLPRTSWLVYASAGLALVVLALVSGLALRHVIARLLMVEPFVIGVALLSLLQPGGGKIFLATVAKSTLCVFVMVLLVVTTRFSDILLSLVRLRVPRLLVTTLALMYRYLFLLIDEAGTIQRARRSRTFSGGRWAVWRSLAAALGQLFILTAERAEHIYAAMCARGWRS